MNSVTTQYRRSQLIARPMPGGKGPAKFVYGVMVSGCFEPVCYQFADWVVGDFNGQAEEVECEHSTDGLKTATASQSGLRWEPETQRVIYLRDGYEHEPDI